MTLDKEESRLATFEHWPHPTTFKATPRTVRCPCPAHARTPA